MMCLAPFLLKIKKIPLRTLFVGLVIAIGFALPAQAEINQSPSHLSLEAHKTKSRTRLEYGTVLYEFYRGDFFAALVNHEYISEHQNTSALNNDGQILKGGMTLSYGMPNYSEALFSGLLDSSHSETTRNAAWYYLSKLYYTKFDLERARINLQRIQGDLPRDIHIDYHYLATLLSSDGEHQKESWSAIEKIKEDLPEYPYFLFNRAVTQLKRGQETEAIAHLESVVDYAYLGEEYEVLADRARHGLALIATSSGKLLDAWQYLSTVRTTGLYSNRALLSYAWAAINLKQYTTAVPALEILDSRSIAIPEVQEAKVLLAYLYEQQGLVRKALKQNITAEKAFAQGLQQLKQARALIASQEVPREFVINLETLVRQTDWYSKNPEVDYSLLTPFLIDLLASNHFVETLKELADLYSMEDNLTYWEMQTEQHDIILREGGQKSFDEQAEKTLAESQRLTDELTNKRSELRLMALTLEPEERDRFNALLDSVENEIGRLNAKMKVLQAVEQPYVQPPEYAGYMAEKHQVIQEKLTTTRRYILQLEKVMRKLVQLELDKHESRMSYYAAQSKLAKARLYDLTLTNLNRAKKRAAADESQSKSAKQEGSEK